MKPIHYIKHKNIDKFRWNNCIDNAPNGLIFATSWFLDVVSPNWDALIMDDYKAVMPLTWKSKYGLKYLIQPNYTKQLGVFGEDVIGIEDEFIKNIPLLFTYANIQGNEQMKQKNSTLLNSTQIIHLKNNAGYNKSTKKNIKKAQRFDLKCSTGSFEDYFTAYKTLDKQYITTFKLKTIERFKASVEINKHSYFSKVSDQDGNLMSIVWILAYKNRAYKISSATPDAGKKVKASFLILDEYLKNKPENIEYFDFMGSSIPGVKEYNRGFGAEEYYFPNIKFNLLNRWIR